MCRGFAFHAASRQEALAVSEPFSAERSVILSEKLQGQGSGGVSECLVYCLGAVRHYAVRRAGFLFGVCGGSWLLALCVLLSGYSAFRVICF